MNTHMKALRNISFLKEEMLEGISVGVRIHPKAALYTICTVLITVVLIIFLLNTGKTVNAAPEHELHKYYTSIEIQPGIPYGRLQIHIKPKDIQTVKHL